MSILPLAPTGLIDLSAIRAPAHIVSGTADRIVDPNRHARPLAAALERARLSGLEEIGHRAHHGAREALLDAVSEAA